MAITPKHSILPRSTGSRESDGALLRVSLGRIERRPR